MANLVITSTTNAIKVAFNDAGASIGIVKGTWRKDKVLSYILHPAYIDVNTFDGSYHVSHTAGAGVFVVDSVDGVSPSSLSDLYDKLTALLG